MQGMDVGSLSGLSGYWSFLGGECGIRRGCRFGVLWRGYEILGRGLDVGPFARAVDVSLDLGSWGEPLRGSLDTGLFRGGIPGRDVWIWGL